MAVKAKNYYIDLGNSLKYGFRSTKDHSKKVGKAKDAGTVKGIAYGINSPKPPRVIARLESAKTISFYIDPTVKVSDLIGLSVGGSKIKSANYD